MSGRLWAGLDVGSLTTKAVVVGEDGARAGAFLTASTPTPAETGKGAVERALESAGASWGHLQGIVGTGYGRAALPFVTRRVTEITCHARGVSSLFPGARLILDVGGQDSKAIRLDGGGKVEDFAMNDKCAAGTGRFLGVLAQSLGTGIEGLGAEGMRSGKLIDMSSTCTVFAESEVVGLVARGESVPDIAHAVHVSLAKRLSGMVRQAGIAQPAVFTGGCALNPDLVSAVEGLLGLRFSIPHEPQLTGALGAALLAKEMG
jgi:predicted CoA-substrate-specific enzyme activase